MAGIHRMSHCCAPLPLLFRCFPLLHTLRASSPVTSTSRLGNPYSTDYSWTREILGSEEGGDLIRVVFEEGGELLIGITLMVSEEGGDLIRVGCKNRRCRVISLDFELCEVVATQEHASPLQYAKNGDQYGAPFVEYS